MVWKWILFTHIFPKDILSIIASNELQPTDENEDQVINWCGTALAIGASISLKFALALIHSDDQSTSD